MTDAEPDPRALATHGRDHTHQSLEVLRLGRGAEGHQPDDRRPGVLRPRRSVGLRQVDPAPTDRRARGGGGRHDRDRGRRRERHAAPRSQSRDGVPELRALSAQDGSGELELQPEDASLPAGSDRAASRQRGRDPRPRHPDGPASRAAFRRTAPTGRHGSRHGPRPGGVPVRRAVVQPGREAPRADANGDPRPAPADQCHVRLRDARPD